MRKSIVFVCLIIFVGNVIFILTAIAKTTQRSNTVLQSTSHISSPPRPALSATPSSFPLAIASMRKKTYPGSAITIEQTLQAGNTYTGYVVSYKSDGLKIYALLTIPRGQKPLGGWPVILLNHGYIPPTQYSTENSYAVMVDSFASAGYIVLKPDYRGEWSV